MTSFSEKNQTVVSTPNISISWGNRFLLIPNGRDSFFSLSTTSFHLNLSVTCSVLFRDLLCSVHDLLRPVLDLLCHVRDLLGSVRDLLGPVRDLLGPVRDLLGPVRDLLGLYTRVSR